MGTATSQRLVMLLLWLFLDSLCSQVIAQPLSFKVDRSLVESADLPKCYDALLDADANGDFRLDFDEHLTFVELMGLPTSIEERPLLLAAKFHYLACLCEDRGGDDDCCVGEQATVDISPLERVMNMTSEDSGEQRSLVQEIQVDDDEQYMYTICLLTERAIETVVQEELTADSREPQTSAPTEPLTPVSTTPPTGPLTPTPTSPPTTPRQLPGVYTPVAVDYRISKLNTTIGTAYLKDLAGAMDIMAPSVVGGQQTQLATERSRGNVFRLSQPHALRGRNGRQRRLQTEDQEETNITVQLPTFIASTAPVVCPSSVTSDATVCETVRASVTLVSPNPLTDMQEEFFVGVLESAVEEGRLQSALQSVAPDSSLRVLEPELIQPEPVNVGSNNTSVGDDGDDDRMPVGAAVGILVSCVAGAGAVVYFLADRVQKGRFSRRRPKKKRGSEAPESVVYHSTLPQDDIEVAPRGTSIRYSDYEREPSLQLSNLLDPSDPEWEPVSPKRRESRRWTVNGAATEPETPPRSPQDRRWTMNGVVSMRSQTRPERRWTLDGGDSPVDPMTLASHGGSSNPILSPVMIAGAAAAFAAGASTRRGSDSPDEPLEHRNDEDMSATPIPDGVSSNSPEALRIANGLPPPPFIDEDYGPSPKRAAAIGAGVTAGVLVAGAATAYALDREVEDDDDDEKSDVSSDLSSGPSDLSSRSMGTESEGDIGLSEHMNKEDLPATACLEVESSEGPGTTSQASTQLAPPSLAGEDAASSPAKAAGIAMGVTAGVVGAGIVAACAMGKKEEDCTEEEEGSQVSSHLSRDSASKNSESERDVDLGEYVEQGGESDSSDSEGETVDTSFDSQILNHPEIVEGAAIGEVAGASMVHPIKHDTPSIEEGRESESDAEASRGRAAEQSAGNEVYEGDAMPSISGDGVSAGAAAAGVGLGAATALSTNDEALDTDDRLSTAEETGAGSSSNVELPELDDHEADRQLPSADATSTWSRGVPSSAAVNGNHSEGGGISAGAAAAIGAGAAGLGAITAYALTRSRREDVDNEEPSSTAGETGTGDTSNVELPGVDEQLEVEAVKAEAAAVTGDIHLSLPPEKAENGNFSDAASTSLLAGTEATAACEASTMATNESVDDASSESDESSRSVSSESYSSGSYSSDSYSSESSVSGAEEMTGQSRNVNISETEQNRAQESSETPQGENTVAQGTLPPGTSQDLTENSNALSTGATVGIAAGAAGATAIAAYGVSKLLADESEGESGWESDSRSDDSSSSSGSSSGESSCSSRSYSSDEENDESVSIDEDSKHLQSNELVSENSMQDSLAGGERATMAIASETDLKRDTDASDLVLPTYHDSFSPIEGDELEAPTVETPARAPSYGDSGFDEVEPATVDTPARAPSYGDTIGGDEVEPATVDTPARAPSYSDSIGYTPARAPSYGDSIGVEEVEPAMVEMPTRAASALTTDKESTAAGTNQEVTAAAEAAMAGAGAATVGALAAAGNRMATLDDDSYDHSDTSSDASSDDYDSSSDSSYDSSDSYSESSASYSSTSGSSYTEETPTSPYHESKEKVVSSVLWELDAEGSAGGLRATLPSIHEMDDERTTPTKQKPKVSGNSMTTDAAAIEAGLAAIATSSSGSKLSPFMSGVSSEEAELENSSISSVSDNSNVSNSAPLGSFPESTTRLRPGTPGEDHMAMKQAAADASQWAIARSLSALQAAEGHGHISSNQHTDMP